MKKQTSLNAARPASGGNGQDETEGRRRAVFGKESVVVRCLAVLTLLLLSPVTAEAAEPIKYGRYTARAFDGGRGVMVVGVSRKNARKIRFAAYCGAPSERAGRPALLYGLKVDKKGRFSYSGRTDRSGGPGEPRVVKGGGDYDVKLKGQFVTRRKIELNITCDGKKTTATLTRGANDTGYADGWPGDK